MTLNLLLGSWRLNRLLPSERFTATWENGNVCMLGGLNLNESGLFFSFAPSFQRATLYSHQCQVGKPQTIMFRAHYLV